ncbi:MAG: hypothetical protein ACRD1V_14475 [Vicinamibacterales bacterium]
MHSETDHVKHPAVRPRRRILVDGGDPDETRAIKDLPGFVDG